MGYLDLNGDVNRRVFIKGLGAVSLGVLLSMFGGCESCRDQIANRPVRRRIRTGSPEVTAALATYRAAVAAMKALPASDPRSWLAQASIHGTPAGFNFCQHGTNHFFSWHRAYLLFFEQICRELTGQKDFGLPYWNWNQNSTIHPDYLDTSSPLYLARNQTNLSSVSEVSNGALDPIMGDTNFFTFSSQLEGTPHNRVHTFVGGTFGGFASARDPIFWNHHCMVDYAWAKWNLEMDNDNPNDAAWTNQSWDHFVDKNGDPASTTAAATLLMPLLSYRYESSAIGAHPAAAVAASGAEFKKLESRIRKGANVRFAVNRRVMLAQKTDLALARPFASTTRVTVGELSQLIEQEPAREHVFASVEYADLPASSDFFVRVFVNLPTADANTPTTDPHFAGSFAFFGTRGGHQGHAGHTGGPKFLVNLTRTLRELRARQEIRQDTVLSLQLVAVPNEKAALPSGEAALTLEKLELIVTPVIIDDGR